MVISSSSRSPSPIPIRSNPNPNPSPNPNSRNDQEREGVGVRKSLNGYPFAKSSTATQPRLFTPNTPANSPAEYARRSSFGRECGALIGDHEQKENERDPNLKPVARVRSPSVLKGTKHFMSPTISAASKINPSPRKKVLGERNEAIRTSVSLSEGKFHFYSTNPLEFSDENESKTDMGTPPCSVIADFSKVGNEVSNTEVETKVVDLSPGVRTIESEPDLVVLSPEIPLNTTKSPETLPQSDMPKIFADSSPSVIAPLDADPFETPYDPKTNFLSPRPQFLHYKPNPRVESYINHGMRLEDNFSSDSVSETETSEEVQSETSLEVQEETSSSVGTSPVVDQQTSSELSSPKSQELEEIVESKIEPRRQISGKWKAFTFLFIILLGSISFSMYSSGVGNSINQEKIMSQIYSNSRVAADLAKENFNVLFLNAKMLSAQSVGYLSQVIFNAREVKFSPLPFSNLSDWQEEGVEDYLVKGFEYRPWFDRKEECQDTAIDKVAEAEIFDNKVAEVEIFDDQQELRKLEDYEEEKLEQSSTFLAFTDQVIEEYEPENQDEYSVTEKSAVKMTEESSTLFDEPEKLEERSVLEADDDSLLENSAVKMIEESSTLFDESEKLEERFVLEDDDSAIEITELTEASLFEDSAVEMTELTEAVQSDLKVEDQPSPSLPGPEAHSQVPTSDVPLSDAVVESEVIEEVKSVSKSPVLEATDKISNILEASERSLTPSTAAISLVVLSLMAATAFMFVKKPKNKTSAVSTPSADHVEQKENSTFIPVASKVRESLSSRSGPVEVDMIESCPSELSSFQKTSSYYKKENQSGRDEAQSVERSSKRNYKRESLASSSSEYTMSSSYGSFTTYSIVHSKQRDDEVVTPVRRSSRIRSKVTSP